MGFWTARSWAHQANATTALDAATAARNRGDELAYTRLLDAADEEITLLEQAAGNALAAGELRAGNRGTCSIFN